ncbi:MAG: hypothetical protein QOE36_3672 [Gaiellaceae bacterium]|jgi:DNA-binding NarL/FixJ family response regulator|nr:hypothetical protein [Gaiellaceae bacterium]
MVVGREDLLRRIETFLGDEGRGVRALMLEGEAGIGKTTLWLEGVECARRRGARVLTTRAVEREATLPFSGLIDLLGPVFDDALHVLPEPQRDALGVALQRRTADSPADELALGLAVRTTLAEAAQPDGILVAIDDEQWLDEPTARTLEFALRRLEGDAAVLLARRTGAGATVLQLEDALPRGCVERIDVGPLGSDALERIVASALDAPASPPELRRIDGWSGGNPYFALELARRLQADPGERRHGVAPAVPPSLQGLLRERLERVPAALQPALLELAAAADLPADALDEDAVSAAAERGLVATEHGRVRFSHPLLRALVYEGASPGRRRKAHRLIADRTTDPDERALHLALASTEANDGAAAELAAAGERATLRGAPGAGAGLLDHAIRLTPTGSRHRAERKLRAAELHYLSGDFDRTRALADELAADLPAGDVRARAVFLQGRLRSDDFAEMRRLFETALAEAEDAALRIEALTELAFAAISSTTFEDARGYAAQALGLAESLGEPALVAQSLSLALFCDDFTGKPVEDAELDRVLRLERAAGNIGADAPSAAIAQILIYAGEVERARPILERSYAAAVEAGDEPGRGVVLYLGFLEWRAGNIARAWEHSQSNDALAWQLGNPQLTAYADFLRAYVLVLRGDVEAAREAIESAGTFAEAAGDRLMLVGVHELHGLLAHSLGDYAAAADAQLASIQLMRELRFREPGVHANYQGAAEALVALDRSDEAEALVEELEELAAALDRVPALAGASRARGFLAAARGDVDEAVAAFERSLEIQSRLPEPFETGRTLLALGSLLRRSQKKSRARVVLEEARATFEQLEAAAWEARANAELARIGGRAARSDGLTPTEDRIAQLVAAGKSNHQIASALVISTRTVEWNLTKVYRKLGVTSRTELAVKLGKR